MRSTAFLTTVIAGVLSLCGVASAQSFNIDLGLDAGPPSTYGAAGLAGEWISVPGTQGVTVTNLTDIDGVPTAARFIQIGGTETLSLTDEAVTGDDAILMNDCLITHSAVENCMFFSEMLPGRYVVLIYARMPDEPRITAITNVDEEIGNPHITVGGPWSGAHVEGVSYSRHVLEVAATGAQAGKLGLHSGVPAGGDFGIGAALNGMQIVKLSAGDINADFVVDISDIISVLAAWGPCAGMCDADTNDDGEVSLADLLAVLASWS